MMTIESCGDGIKALANDVKDSPLTATIAAAIIGFVTNLEGFLAEAVRVADWGESVVC